VEHAREEKIKTIGDAYMVVAGLPSPRPDHREIMATMALQMLEGIHRLNQVLGTSLDVRIGLHSGPVIAGIIGTRKFAYDVAPDGPPRIASIDTRSGQL
jgi:adenylate cyclase